MSLLSSIAGPILGGLVGGYFDYKAQKQQSEDAAASREQADRLNAQNIAMQKEFAQTGIQWRVEDAKKAGIHPLAALGGGGAAYAPSSVVGSYDSGRPEFLRSTGQNISRAINQAMTPDQKVERALRLKSLDLDNQLKQKEIDGLNTPGIPGLTSNSSLGRHLLGQNPLNYNYQGGYVTEQPTQKSHASPGKPHQAAGEYTDYVFARTATGLHPVPSKEMQEAIEDKFVPETLWALRNYAFPTLNSNMRNAMRPSLREHPLPRGWVWQWNPFAAEFQPRNTKAVPRNIKMEYGD